MSSSDWVVATFLAHVVVGAIAWGVWQSYAPGAKTKAVLNQTRKSSTATTTNSDSNNNNNNNSQDTNNDNNNNNNNKVDIDIIDRLDMNNISMT